MLWLYLDFPQLQLDHYFPTNVLCETPVIVVDGHHNKVVQCNQAAIDCGVRIGFGLGRAISLNAQMKVLNYKQSLTEQSLIQMTQSAYQVVADIAIMPPHGLLLRLTPMFKLYGNLQGCWQHITQWLSALHVNYRGACADNPAVAQLLAHDQSLNNAFINDDIKAQQAALSLISIDHLAYNAKIIDQLNHLGLKTIGSLLSLPMSQLISRFDSEFLAYVSQVRGELPYLFDFYLPKTPFSYHQSLHYELNTTVHLTPVLQQGLTQLSQYLICRDKIAFSIILHLGLRDAPTIKLVVVSAQGEQAHNAWLTLGKLQLERVTLNAPIISLAIDCHDVASKTTLSDDLLSEHCHSANQHQLSQPQLISLLHAKLGESKVHRLDYYDSHLPEIVGGISGTKHASSDEYAFVKNTVMSLHRGGLRPSYLLETPEPLTMQATIYHGPERICSHWWQKNSINRDYYIAKNAQQQWCWVFQIPTGRWFVHGYFG